MRGHQRKTTHYSQWNKKIRQKLGSQIRSLFTGVFSSSIEELGFWFWGWILIESGGKEGAWWGFWGGLRIGIDMRRRAPDFRRPARRRLSYWIWWLLGIFSLAGLLLFVVQHRHQDHFDRPIQVWTHLEDQKVCSFSLAFALDPALILMIWSIMKWSGSLCLWIDEDDMIEIVSLRSDNSRLRICVFPLESLSVIAVRMLIWQFWW